MNTRSKILIGAVLGVGLLALGVASAHGGFGSGAAAAGGDPVCDDNMTVGDCRAARHAYHEEQRQAHYDACVEEHGQEFCDAVVAKMEQRHGMAGNGTAPPGHFRGHAGAHAGPHGGPGGHGPGACPGHPPEGDDDNSTA